ncbi:type VI secretion system baseplate subunit TssK [Thalassomonas actiniarum]|uniref:Type VI secretion system baseplate subunit TssK n=1 Tax=Thalassomonas actiniarum TaxID=485447 RepID=A0AAE9YIA5_9GAMM|nr:type VI secretion system baseplate subunit TssK [Thalassomonas actiniarum]WDD96567.1 type VI secretion system baseplate subunit TssK [Thalassomonas actiniarum]
MNNKARTPQSICWHEGMLLSPQHFQQNHLYWEAQLQLQMLSIAQYRWGIMALSLDEGQLLEGKVDIRQLKAVMPDGLYIDYNTQHDTALQLDLADNEELAKNKAVKVHLTVPIRVPGSASDSTDIQRFNVSDGQPVKDDNTGEGEMVLQYLQPILSLQAVNKVKAQYISLPLLEISQVDDGQFSVTDYCPPVFGIGGDNFLTFNDFIQTRKPLQHKCQALALSLRKKARQLAGFSEDGEQQLGSRITEQHSVWIRAMVQNLAELELVSDNENSSPWEVYQVLARMAGGISILDPGRMPPKLPRYDHKDILPSLAFVLDYIGEQVNRVNLKYTSIAFDETRDGFFTLTYDKAWAGRDLLIELIPRENTSLAEQEQWLKACRIASSTLHNDLKTKRVLGAETASPDPEDSSGVTAASGHGLFYIKKNKDYIKVGQTLVLTCTSGKLKDFQPKRIVLHLPHEA